MPSIVTRGEERLVVIHPGPELGMVADGEGWGLPHPDVPLPAVPADEGFIAGKLIKAVEVLDLDAPPVELGAGQQKFLPP